MRYVNEFLHLSCAPDILRAKLFPNSKEITESFATYRAVRQHLQSHVALNDPTVTLVTVGDGTTPRTAATFAFRTAWNCISIDPRLRKKERWKDIQRLQMIALPIEQYGLYIRGGLGQIAKIVIIAVHAHVDLNVVVNQVKGDETYVVAIPCCVPQEIDGHLPDLTYVDRGIWSPSNTVKIWKFMKEKDV